MDQRSVKLNTTLAESLNVRWGGQKHLTIEVSKACVKQEPLFLDGRYALYVSKHKGRTGCSYKYRIVLDPITSYRSTRHIQLVSAGEAWARKDVFECSRFQA
ncbi:hypothetical protein PoB_001718400 [Plakobranchus ocellatus]|uniref:Uncharacterized protein n=1 Tax=Plakobranchus ocellatus TaxID=259542 RepID=A0AAV3Z8D3_9GAST|nr:hypothetical protein PoB_001718400 [Plakobranchus ocellatus]